MANEVFVFNQSPSLQTFASRLETPKGEAALHEVRTEFASLVDLSNHTQQHAGDTTIHVPDGNNITFTHITKAYFTQLAAEVGHILGVNL